MGNIDRRIFHVRQDERKLYTGVPVFRRFTFPRMLQIKRSVLGVVSVGKEENPPCSQVSSGTDLPGNITHQGYPPHLNTGPCSFRSNFLQFSMCHVWYVSSSVSRSGFFGRTRSIIAASEVMSWLADCSQIQAPRMSWSNLADLSPRFTGCIHASVPIRYSSLVVPRWREGPGW
jgi:hypothetical protein